MKIVVYQSTEPDTPPSRAFVAVLEWKGHKGSRFITTFLWGPTEQDARQKGQEWLDAELAEAAKKNPRPKAAKAASPAPEPEEAI